MILEAIYEPVFDSHSHGFRPGKSCHTALRQISSDFTGVVWFIEGDIQGCFDNINHEKLIEILSRKIKDSRFLNIIRQFLKAGYIENWKYNATYSGSPQGGICSPILANIYLNELDKKFREIAERFDKPRSAYKTPEYHAADKEMKMETIWEGTGIFEWPLPGDFSITSPFGYRTDPITGEVSFHDGVDIAASEGTAILAAADGVVVTANRTDSWGGSFGYYVTIQHDETYETLYAHCSEVLVKAGQEVEQWDVIALVGSTGNSTGNHLHFEVREGGNKVDAMEFFQTKSLMQNVFIELL